MAQKYSDEQVLEALVMAGSAKQAARRLGCSLSCVRDRLSKPAFKAKYEKAKADALGDAIDNLSIRLTTAVDVLAKVMTDSETAATVRVSAADSVLRHGLRYIEMFDVLKRLEALEAKQEENR